MLLWSKEAEGPWTPFLSPRVESVLFTLMAVKDKSFLESLWLERQTVTPETAIAFHLKKFVKDSLIGTP